MGPKLQALIWASAIIFAAVIANANGLSDNASLAVVLGLSGAALASLSSGGRCKRGCRT